MDTVEPSRGKKAVLHEDGTITSDGSSVLGADDVSGIVIILEALRRLQEHGIPHRTAELLFPVAEEPYGPGSLNADYTKLKAKEAYVLDLDGSVGDAANAAPTLISFTVAVHGKAAHAGFAPQDGIHAIAAAANAIVRIPLGTIKPGMTCNIGVINGGEAGNIVPELCTVRGEIRSLDHSAALEQLDKITAVFREEAALTGATAKIEYRIEITAYKTSPDSPVANRFRKACEVVGVPCNIHPTLGGSDNNNFALHGIDGLVVACSMHNIHSVREFCRLDELELCIQLIMRLLTEVD
jgi:tripeptide aminopeptidase